MLSDQSGGEQRHVPEDGDMLWLYFEDNTYRSTLYENTEMHQTAEMCWGRISRIHRGWSTADVHAEIPPDNEDVQ